MTDHVFFSIINGHLLSTRVCVLFFLFWRSTWLGSMNLTVAGQHRTFTNMITGFAIVPFHPGRGHQNIITSPFYVES